MTEESSVAKISITRRSGNVLSCLSLPLQADKPAVEELARRLAKEGILAWLDKWNLIPGAPWQPAIEKALAECETCAVFMGPNGFGPWQNEEIRAHARCASSARRPAAAAARLAGTVEQTRRAEADRECLGRGE